MLTNPSTSSTSVSSSSLVEASSLSPPSSTAAPTTVGNATPNLQNSTKPKTPSKRRKKDNTDVEIVVPIAVESSSAVINDNSKKRSRKQKIDTFRNEYDLPILEGLSAGDKSYKRKKGGRKASTADNNINDVNNSRVKKEGSNVKKNIVARSKGGAPPELSKKSKKSVKTATASTAAPPPSDDSVVSYEGPQNKIVLKRSEFIDPNLSFTIFSDLSRGLGAIGPSQVILAVESTREPGSREAFFKDLSDSDSKSAKKPIVGQFQLFDLLLSVPHFLPLTSVYSSGEPFARILRYSALEQYTNGVQGKNQVSTFRFYGPRYEKQVPALPAAQEKAVAETAARNPNAYLDSVLIIKHPILGFYSRKLVSLKFVVLKKVPLDSCVVGHLKAKVVQLRRSADLKNIEIYVDESRVPEAASDVSAMNQQNIQPVIQTPSGLVPVITRTAYQPQQEYHIQPQQELAETQFQYVQYQYQTATELVQEISSNSVGGPNNYILSLDNSGLLFDGAQTFRDETGAQVLILSPSGDDSYVQQHQQPAQQQQIIHQLQDHASYYPGQEQSVIIQQHPQPQSSQLQQQQSYTIQQQQQQAQQQQHQQLIQIQPSQQSKEVTRQLIYLPGSSCPIELQFIPEQSQQEDSTRHYNQPQQIQLQVQAPQQYRPGQQLVVQQNQFQIQQQQQAIQQHVINSQGQVVRQQQLLQQNSTSAVPNSAQSFQYRTQQQQQSQQIVHHTAQQQHHQIPAPVSNQSVAIQQSHQAHPGNQVSTIQALPSSSHQVRYQSAQQPGHTQQIQQNQLVQQVPRQQVIQQQAVPVPQAQQSPQKAAQAPPQVPVYQQQQQQRPQQYQQQVQQQFPQGGTPYTLPATTAPQPAAPIITTTPAKQKGTKTKQPKGSPKKNAKGGNFNQASTNLDDQYLSPEQLEQLRQREHKGLVYQSQQPTPPPPPQVPSQQGFPPVAPPPSFPAPPQGGARSQSPSVRPKGRRPPAPPPPIISSTASLARLPSVSPGTSARLPVAPNSQTPSTTSSALSVAPQPVKKTFYVVNSNSNASGTSSPTATSGPANAITRQVPLVKTKPGFIALCPRCGVGNTNIVRCQRCKVEFPANVKLIQDDWNVNRAGAVVAVASKTSSPRTTTPSPPTTSDNKNSKVSAASSSAANSKVPAKNSGAGKKIVLVNKPNILESSAVIGKTVVTPGTVQVRIQPDGGSAVTITNSGTAVIQTQTKINTPVSKPVAKKRPTQRRKLECITLSSDEEEEPEPKVSKQEEKPSTSTTTAPSTSATNSTAVAATTASTTTSTVTATSAVTSSATSGVVSGTQAGTGNSNQVPDNKKQVVGAVSSTTTPTGEIAMPKKKGTQIDITPEKDQLPQREEIEVDANEVFAKIDTEMSIVGNKFQYTQMECRSVRVGSYKVTHQDVGHDIAVQVTELGFKFTLPCANFKRKIAKVCIPTDSIIRMEACFTKRLTVIFITTGPKYAAWIRQHLGMDGDAENEQSNFYCPLSRHYSQRAITILGEEEPSAADIGIVKKMFKDILVEIPHPMANDRLMRVASLKYKCSIGMNPENSPPEAVESPADRPMPLPPAPSSTVSTVSQATTVLVGSPKEQSTPTINSSAGSSAGTSAVQDPDKVVLSYEGPNSNKVAISPNDIKGLGYSQFLNDQIIDFWLAVIQMERLSVEDKQKTFVFDSFFYKKLTEKIKRRNEEDGNMTAGERRHARVKKRTKNVDIFSKDFLIVPINENYHWFLAIICFPGLEGFHDYNSLEALPNYKRPKTTNNSNKSSAGNNNKKPIVHIQPKTETSSQRSRDEAPEDSEEMDQMSSPDTPGTDGSESKSQGKTESGGESSNEKASAPRSGEKRKSEFGHAVKHPCILIFDSLAGDARGRIYSTLREYLRIEYKTKKNAERTFDKNAMPGIMPKVPQQPNFSDCGLFLLQYVESFFSDPIPNYEPKDINLKNWFTPASIAQNKRREIYEFILNKVKEKSPHNECRIPTVSFEPDENDLMNDEEMYYRNHPDYEPDSDDDEFESDDDSDDESFKPKPKTSRQPNNNRQPSTSSSSSSNKKGSDSDDHNYATTPPKPGSIPAVQVANTNAVVLAISPLPATSDTTLNKNT